MKISVLSLCFLFLVVIALWGCDRQETESDYSENFEEAEMGYGNSGMSGDENPTIGVIGNASHLLPGRDAKSRHQNFITIAKIAQKFGEPHPTVLAAQWCGESNWGANVCAKNNLFGIKAVKGESYTMCRTREEVKGKSVWIMAPFKNLNTIDESIRDRVDFVVRNGRYRKHGYFSARTPADAIDALARAGYATDSGYRKLLLDCIKSVRYNGRRLNPHQPIRFTEDFDDYATAGSNVDARGLM